MGIRLEARTSTPAWLNAALSLGAVAAALVLCAGLIKVAGADVIAAYTIMFEAAFGDIYALTETCVKAAPLTFTGLAIAVAFRAKFWNIGAEGQLIAGAVAGCWTGGFAGLPGPLAILLMFVAGAAGGAAVALVPAILRVKLKVDDVVSSLLINSIVYYAMMALIEGPWKDPLSGYPNSPPIQDSANFPVFLEGTRLHLGIFVAALAVPAIWFLMRRTTLGFRIRAVGENPEASAYGGIRVDRVLLTAAALSGALAGLAGVGEVGGVHYQVLANLSGGFGYSGIVIAMLARLNPLGVIPAALFFAAVMTGAEAMSRATGVPVFLADVIQGTALICMLVALLFTAYRIRRTGGTAGVGAL
ncbi:MAG: ABC transporter permease [Hyphomicrobium sp.]|jgi:simple sugar transport system permease protein